jgi:hypothetical protein
MRSAEHAEILLALRFRPKLGGFASLNGVKLMPRNRRSVLIILFAALSGPAMFFAQPSQDTNPDKPGNQTSQCPTKPVADSGKPLDGRNRPLSIREKQTPCCDIDHGPIINISAEPESGGESISSPEKTPPSVFLSWLFGWQGLTFFFLIFFLIWPSRLRALLSPFRSFKLFGAEFVLNRAGGEEVEERMAELRQKEKEKFDNAIALRKMTPKFQKIVDDYIKPKLSQFDSLEIRATIHVQDLLFEDALYQLLDYYPSQGSGRGRSFSSRSGIIGKTWRLGKSQYAEVVPVDEERLILDWGMTRAEADRAGHGRQSFACVLMRSIDEKLGLIYFDSPSRKAFGNDKDSELWKDLEANITKGATETGLIADLSVLNRELIRPSAFIRIFS